MNGRIMSNKNNKNKKREYVHGKVSDENKQKQVQVFSVVEIHTVVFWVMVLCNVVRGHQRTTVEEHSASGLRLTQKITILQI